MLVPASSACSYSRQFPDRWWGWLSNAIHQHKTASHFSTVCLVMLADKNAFVYGRTCTVPYCSPSAQGEKLTYAYTHFTSAKHPLAIMLHHCMTVLMLCTRRERKSSSGRHNNRGTRCLFPSVLYLGPPHHVVSPPYRFWVLSSNTPITNRAAVALQTPLHSLSTGHRLTRTTDTFRLQVWVVTTKLIRLNDVNLSSEQSGEPYITSIVSSICPSCAHDWFLMLNWVVNHCALAVPVHWKAKAVSYTQGACSWFIQRDLCFTSLPSKSQDQ